MGARHRVGIGLLYRPARLHRLAEFIPWNRFRGPIHVQKFQLCISSLANKGKIFGLERLNEKQATFAYCSFGHLFYARKK